MRPIYARHDIAGAILHGPRTQAEGMSARQAKKAGAPSYPNNSISVFRVVRWPGVVRNIWQFNRTIWIHQLYAWYGGAGALAIGVGDEMSIPLISEADDAPVYWGQDARWTVYGSAAIDTNTIDFGPAGFEYGPGPIKCMPQIGGTNYPVVVQINWYDPGGEQ